jgi:hypothetical protein
VHLHHDRLDLFLRSQFVETLPRLHRRAGESGPLRRIDFRHVNESLRRKPRTLLRAQLQSDLLPGENWRQLSGDNEVVRRFASINCYHFCLSPGNTGIRPSSALASSVSSAPAEFTRTTSYRVAHGYRSANGIDPVFGTQAPGVRVATATTGRARPRTPPGGWPPQRDGANGSPAIR